MAGGLVSIVGENVPAAEDQVVQSRQGDKVLDQWRAFFRALAEAYGTHLGQRADWIAQACLDCFDAGDESGGHGPHAGDEYAEFPFCFFDVYRLVHDDHLSFDCRLAGCEG